MQVLGRLRLNEPVSRSTALCLLALSISHGLLLLFEDVSKLFLHSFPSSSQSFLLFEICCTSLLRASVSSSHFLGTTHNLPWSCCVRLSRSNLRQPLQSLQSRYP